jgi:S-adenosylmethionine:tRNA ribosyltransferase-isomerase
MMDDDEQAHAGSAAGGPAAPIVPCVHKLSTYDYELPAGLIAQEPATARDQARLLVIHRSTGRLAHHSFRDLPELLDPTDLLVINETKVVPVALTARKESGGTVELLVLDPAAQPETYGYDRARASRVCQYKASKPLRPGMTLRMDGGPELTVVSEVQAGRALVAFPVQEWELATFLERWGSPPLPPYIRPAGRRLDRDRERYQTVYARTAGSVAAPTAGLHFTPELFARLEERGIEIATVLLHVGMGTFAPVRDEDIRVHRMEEEYYEIPQSSAEAIERAYAEGRRIIAVGTTSVRAVESAVGEDGALEHIQGRTHLFITPGYAFSRIRGLITNFHLPRSTLLMLVAAFAGLELTMAAYREAIASNYRFYSYGDACLIVD